VGVAKIELLLCCYQCPCCAPDAVGPHDGWVDGRIVMQFAEEPPGVLYQVLWYMCFCKAIDAICLLLLLKPCFDLLVVVDVTWAYVEGQVIE
jgi:hypothetical protein